MDNMSLSVDALEYMTYEKIKEALNQMDYIKLLEMEVISITKGEVVAKLTVRKDLVNHVGAVHGGVLYSMSDTFAGVAAATYGKSVVTVNSHYEYIKAAYGKEFISKSYVTKAGKSMIRATSEIYDTDDNMICYGLFTYFLIDDNKYKEQNTEE